MHLRSSCGRSLSRHPAGLPAKRRRKCYPRSLPEEWTCTFRHDANRWYAGAALLLAGAFPTSGSRAGAVGAGISVLARVSPARGTIAPSGTRRARLDGTLVRSRRTRSSGSPTFMRHEGGRSSITSESHPAGWTPEIEVRRIDRFRDGGGGIGRHRRRTFSTSQSGAIPARSLCLARRHRDAGVLIQLAAVIREPAIDKRGAERAPLFLKPANSLKFPRED